MIEKRSFNLLGVEMWLDEQRHVQAKATGRLAPLVQDNVQRYFAKTKDLKVLATRNGSNVYTLYQPEVPSSAAIKQAANKLIDSVTRKHTPSTATLAITKRCQCNCEHCSAQRFMRNPKPEVTTEDVLRVTREAQELGCVTVIFVGGEPLMHPDIYEFIASVDREEARPSIFTNGLLLTDKNIEKLIDAGCHAVHVSIDDVDPEVHDAGRRLKGVHAKAVAGVKRCLEAGLLTGMSCYASPEKVARGEIEKMILWAKELGVHELTVFDIVPTGRLLREEEKILLSPDDKKYLQDLAAQYNEGPELPGIQMQATVNSPKGFGCFAAWWQFYMTSSGDITPCDFTPLTWGNIKDESLHDIWARMTSHEAYCEHAENCRMQNREFRAKYIDVIPDDADLPYPMYDPAQTTAKQATPEAVGQHGS